MEHNGHSNLKVVLLLTDKGVIHQRKVKAFVSLNLKSSFRSKNSNIHRQYSFIYDIISYIDKQCIKNHYLHVL